MVKRISRLFLAVFAGVLSVLLPACGLFKPVPPVYNLYGHQGLVLLPFANDSQDPALGHQVQDELAGQILRLNALPISEQGEVSRFLAVEAAGNAAADPNFRKRVALRFNSDLVMEGSVESYTESIEDKDPERMITDSKTGAAKWGYYTVRQVGVAAVAKIFDASTGNLLWEKRSRGNGNQQRWHDLDYPGDKTTPPPGGWGSYQMKAKAREFALENPGKPFFPQGQQVRPPQAGNTAPGQPIININIQNNNSQQQNQTAIVAAPVKPALLYQTDTVFASLRETAISQCTQWLAGDFRGQWGWTPGVK